MKRDKVPVQLGLHTGVYGGADKFLLPGDTGARVTGLKRYSEPAVTWCDQTCRAAGLVKYSVDNNVQYVVLDTLNKRCSGLCVPYFELLF